MGIKTWPMRDKADTKTNSHCLLKWMRNGEENTSKKQTNKQL